MTEVRRQLETSDLPADEILMEMANAISESDGHAEVVYFLNPVLSQLYLSACVRNGEWILTPFDSFSTVCGNRGEHEDL